MNETGCLVFYYSSRESSIPVRDVRNNWDKDHKKEPNIETSTYGKYSCCNCGARNSAKRDFGDGRKYIFFLTNYDPRDMEPECRGRQIVAYYKLGTAKEKKCRMSSLALARTCWWWEAEEIKLCYPGLMLAKDCGWEKPKRFEIDWNENTIRNASGPCRGFWKLKWEHVEPLLKWFDSRPQSQMISGRLWSREVKKLERMNIRDHGVAYPERRKKVESTHTKEKCK